ncbi:MAG: serine/threonine-protein kinase [Acidobacteriota bacterium]
MSDPALDARARRVFERVIDAPAGEEEVLGSACADDPELRQRVEELLEHDRSASAFLETPRLDDCEDWTGRRLGAYRIRAEIGRGGMSRVFAAERCDGEFQHEVAIKVLRSSLAAWGLEGRLRSERQILADLVHPAITRLLDGGTTDDGLPYVVMERVRGWPLDVTADRERMTLAQRVELFRRVVDAVHVAHRQLILHCDLKPTNVLVDADGHPKLLDFGIARVFDVSNAEHLELRGLTPGYASPELKAGERVSIASDVYSLGVMLFELLTGHRPQAGQLASQALSAADPWVAERRRVTMRQLRRQLAGDLDAIISRCLEPDPERRYASAQHLADDLGRWLEGREVAVRPDGLGGALRRFSRRQPGLAAALAALGLAGSLLLASSTVRGVRLAEERERVQVAAERASEVTEAMLELVQVASPDRAHGISLASRQVLDRAVVAAERLEVDSSSQQRLLTRLGMLYRQLGEPHEAERLLRQVVEGAVEAGAVESSVTAADSAAVRADAQAELARVLRDAGKLDQAAATVAAALAAADQGTARHSRLLALRAQVAIRGGDLEAADVDSLQALDVARTIGDDEQLVDALLTRAHLLYERSQYQEGAALAEEAETVARASFGELHSLTAETLHATAALAERAGELERARQLAARSERLHRRLYGDDHPLVAEVLMLQGQVANQGGDYEKALVAFEASADIRRRRLGADHPLVAVAVNDAAVAHYRLGRYQEAEALFRQGLDIRRRALPAGHPDIGQAINSLAGTRQARGDFAGARDLYREALEIGLATRGPEHADVGSYHHNLAWMERNLERPWQAEEHYRQALASWIAGQGSDHPLVAMARHNLGWLLSADPARLDEAEALVRQALSSRQRKLGDEHPSVADSRVLLAELLRHRGRVDDAVAAFGPAIEIYRQTLPERHWKTAMAQSVDGALAADLGDARRARRLLDAAHAELSELLGPEAVATREAERRSAALAALPSVGYSIPNDSSSTGVVSRNERAKLQAPGRSTLPSETAPTLVKSAPVPAATEKLE